MLIASIVVNLALLAICAGLIRRSHQANQSSAIREERVVAQQSSAGERERFLVGQLAGLRQFVLHSLQNIHLDVARNYPYADNERECLGRLERSIERQLSQQSPGFHFEAFERNEFLKHAGKNFEADFVGLADVADLGWQLHQRAMVTASEFAKLPTHAGYTNLTEAGRLLELSLAQYIRLTGDEAKALQNLKVLVSAWEHNCFDQGIYQCGATT